MAQRTRTEPAKAERAKPGKAEADPARAALAGGLPVEGLPAWQLARRQKIVQAALRALEDQEYERIQIRDVAISAGVALGTLYRYFSSKEHLYAAVLLEWAAFGQSRPGRSADANDRIRKRVHALIRVLQRQPQFFKVYVLLQASGDANARELLVEFARVAHQSLADEFDMLDPEEAQDVSIMLWSIINSMLTYAVFEGRPMAELRRVVDRYLDLLGPRIS